MQQNSDQVKFIVGEEKTLENLHKMPTLPIFSDEAVTFLEELSKYILKHTANRKYPDVITFAFWCRRGSVLKMKEQYESDRLRIGKGVVFHIAPSNVPVNFAYSMAAGLLAGNANIVRIPSKEFEQVDIICNSINEVLRAGSNQMKNYIYLVKYGHSREINNYFSSLCNTRVIWGGDQTIAELRTSNLPPRANEITFADRYSIAVINSDHYLKESDPHKIASDFYNDTFLTDQNACTSPKLIVWLGDRVEEAKEVFWENLYDFVKENYSLQPVQAVNKLTALFLLAESHSGVHATERKDNTIVRVNLDKLEEDTMEFCSNSGFFMEYTAKNLSDILPVCSRRCQTLAYYGVTQELLADFIKVQCPEGIDRIVPIGKTMDFQLIWDGIDLICGMSREIHIL